MSGLNHVRYSNGGHDLDGGDEPGENEIRKFWEDHPVGTDFVDAEGDWSRFFQAYDDRRESTEPHIREELAAIDFSGRNVLEVGTGQGREAQIIIERGGIYHGADATEASIRRVRKRLEIRRLQYASLLLMDAERLAFASASFDIVFSHGVLHHTPRIREAIGEIHRVLRPGGTAVIMVYHRNSANYHLSIRIIRRLGILILHVDPLARVISRLTGEPMERLRAHTTGLKASGISYLRMPNFLHKSTDGPHNVFSSVFTRRDVLRLFEDFSHVDTRVHLLNERHFPIVRSLLPKRLKRAIERRFGWHLWVVARK